MQKQWGLYLGSLLFFLVVLGLVYVAGPEAYPQSGGRGAGAVPRSTYVENQLITFGATVVFVAIAVPLVGRGFSPRMKPAVRAYWTEHPEEYRRLTTAWILNTAIVGTIGYGLMVLVKSAFTTMPSAPLGFVLVAAIMAMLFRGLIPVVRPPISGLSGAAPSDSSGRSASPGS
ncbi:MULTISPECIES: hypothetical protein [Tsukamurella]|uniref:Uncharacterized protein n=2 Tax=Tsukamurella TaxID=2060 RepID=A0A5C5RVV1_9ACTN|nr:MULTISPECIES: hypothetical protein [Tsukamurella]NMD56352.1 hypothetical protein [Tsukamurella columbiensis]TWS26904.1 hypothetical protein FK530_21080 [Tsukamurella conjunctivitidis]